MLTLITLFIPSVDSIEISPIISGNVSLRLFSFCCPEKKRVCLIWFAASEFNCTKWNKANVSCLTNALKLFDVLLKEAFKYDAYLYWHSDVHKWQLHLNVSFWNVGAKLCKTLNNSKSKIDGEMMLQSEDFPIIFNNKKFILRNSNI